MKTIKKIFYTLVVIALAALVVLGMYYGEDIANKFQAKRVEYVTVKSEPEVVVTDEFEELVKSFEESPEGKEALRNWASQKALSVQREKLNTLEKDLLKKEASL